MGNYRFRLSDMIPNAWFYKLKDMRRSTRKKHPPPPTEAPPHPAHPHHLFHQRKSYYFTRHLTPNTPPNPNPNASPTHFPDPPRKSSKKRRSLNRNRPSPRLVTTSVSAGCSCRSTVESVCAKPDSTPEEYPNSPLHSSSDHESLLPELGSDNALAGDIFDNMDSKSFDVKSEKLEGFEFDSVSELDLPPIITKPGKREKNEPQNFKKVVKDEIIKEQRTRISVNSPGVKLRTNSPRIVSRKLIQARKTAASGASSNSRRSLSESVAVVKTSKDPQRDFKESMVEMIMENNIRASKDLEDLLACYLSLNSDEYHDLIIKVFKQIWFDVTDVRLN